MKAILFPGQGSQKTGMGKTHFAEKKSFQNIVSRADSLLGYSISDIMFEGPAETLTQTQFTQPAIFVHSAALMEILDIEADMVAGHSLGEYTALYAAGVLDFESALSLVSLRGQLMQKAGDIHPGTMAAIIGMEDHLVDDICREATRKIQKPVVPANYNCPGQLVISGDTDAVKKAIDMAKEQGCRIARMLPVSGAFHSPLMKPALQPLEEKLNGIAFSKAKCDVYSNVTAKASKDPQELKENLIRQLVQPVRWTETLLHMENDGATSFIEVGPGNVLQGLTKRTVTGKTIDGYE